MGKAFGRLASGGVEHEFSAIEALDAAQIHREEALEAAAAGMCRKAWSAVMRAEFTLGQFRAHANSTSSIPAKEMKRGKALMEDKFFILDRVFKACGRAGTRR